MTALDSLDQQLLQLLGADARQSSETLAKRLHVSPSTVRRRLRRLIQSNVAHISVLVDPIQAGFPLRTVIALDIAHEKLESALQKLAGYSPVKWVSTTIGRFDVLILAVFHSTDELSDFVQRELLNIEGLRDSETFVCLQVKKGSYVQM